MYITSVGNRCSYCSSSSQSASRNAGGGSRTRSCGCFSLWNCRNLVESEFELNYRDYQADSRCILLKYTADTDDKFCEWKHSNSFDKRHISKIDIKLVLKNIK